MGAVGGEKRQGKQLYPEFSSWAGELFVSITVELTSEGGVNNLHCGKG